MGLDSILHFLQGKNLLLLIINLDVLVVG